MTMSLASQLATELHGVEILERGGSDGGLFGGLDGWMDGWMNERMGWTGWSVMPEDVAACPLVILSR